MKITAMMNLQELARLIGNEASLIDAAMMRNALLAKDLHGIDTQDVPECLWQACLDSVLGGE